MKIQKKSQNENGITLIALVITIIVLLILAGVSISMLSGDNSILKQATNAGEKTENASIDERIKIINAEALTEGKGILTFENLKNILDKEFGDNYEITGDSSSEKWVVTIIDPNREYTFTRTGTIKEFVQIASTNQTKPFLPEGAYITNNSLSTGLTIKDANDNEWVWIEVPKSITEGKDTEDQIKTALVNYTKNDKSGAAFINRGNYVDKWFALDGETLITEDTQGLTDEQKALDNGCGLNWEEYRAKRKAMYESIQKYGGFYIGKYEVGIQSGESGRENGDAIVTTLYPATQTPKVQADLIPYNWIRCQQAEDLSESLNPGKKSDGEDTTSSLMFGIQWDLVMRYLNEKGVKTTAELKTDSTNWGVYNNNKTSENTALTVISDKAQKTENNGRTWSSIAKNTIKSKTMLLTTGAIKEAKTLNIYDLAGNVWEWTLEKSPNINTPCVHRGGGFSVEGYNYTAATRHYHTINDTLHRYGFRATLY